MWFNRTNNKVERNRLSLDYPHIRDSYRWKFLWIGNLFRLRFVKFPAPTPNKINNRGNHPTNPPSGVWNYNFGFFVHKSMTPAEYCIVRCVTLCVLWGCITSPRSLFAFLYRLVCSPLPFCMHSAHLSLRYLSVSISEIVYIGICYRTAIQQYHSEWEDEGRTTPTIQYWIFE